MALFGFASKGEARRAVLSWPVIGRPTAAHAPPQRSTKPHCRGGSAVAAGLRPAAGPPPPFYRPLPLYPSERMHPGPLRNTGPSARTVSRECVETDDAHTLHAGAQSQLRIFQIFFQLRAEILEFFGVAQKYCDALFNGAVSAKRQSYKSSAHGKKQHDCDDRNDKRAERHIGSCQREPKAGVNKKGMQGCKRHSIEYTEKHVV